MDQVVLREQSIHHAKHFPTGTTINPAGSLSGGAGSHFVGGTQNTNVEVGALSLQQQHHLACLASTVKLFS
jgi:hypothetical protein